MTRRIPTWLWIAGGLVAVLATVFLSPLVALIALVVAITGVVALARNSPTWLRFTSRKRAVIWTVASAVVFFVAGSISSAAYPTDDSSASDEPVAVETPAATPTPTPTPTPFADDAAAPVAFAGEAGTAKDMSATADQSALAVLATLEVKGRAPKTGYDRDEFGQRWLDVDRNGCDTRNDILARDLADVVRSGPCRVTSGSLLDPFTGTGKLFVRGQGTSEGLRSVDAQPLRGGTPRSPGFSWSREDHPAGFLAPDELEIVRPAGSLRSGPLTEVRHPLL